MRPPQSLHKKHQVGEKREWLKVTETAPPPLLTAHEQAKHSKLSHPEVWKTLGWPQKSVAVYRAEYHSQKDERRGVDTNRWSYSMVNFCYVQEQEEHRKLNGRTTPQNMVSELYVEIDKILPSLEYRLAPKKEHEKKGTSSLRSSAEVSTNTPKDEKELLEACGSAV